MTTSRDLVRPAALAFAGLLAVSGAVPAAAQDSEPEARGWTVTIGGGAQLLPKYPGADDVGIFPMPIVDLRRRGRPLPFRAPDQGIGFRILGDDSPFDFGPALQFQTRRQEEDVGAAVGDVGFTVEAGGFAELNLGRHFRLRAEGRRGLGGHDGWVGDLSADLVVRDRDTTIFSIGPRARFSDDNYHDAYFSVTPAVAAATGLPAFDADGGFHAVGVVAGFTRKLDRRWGIYAYAGYDRLVGDAADSPIVRTFGSRNQYAAGLGLFYSFDVERPFGR